MKNTFLKISTSILFTFSLNACDLMNVSKPQAPNIKGVWENNIKSADGSSILTTLEIKDIKEMEKKNYQPIPKYTYSASLASKLNGTKSDNLNISTDKINISGIIDGNFISITDVDSENESISTKTRLVLSKDENYLTLIPSETKFRRKK